MNISNSSEEKKALVLWLKETEKKETVIRNAIKNENNLTILFWEYWHGFYEFMEKMFGNKEKVGIVKNGGKLPNWQGDYLEGLFYQFLKAYLPDDVDIKCNKGKKFRVDYEIGKKDSTSARKCFIELKMEWDWEKDLFLTDDELKKVCKTNKKKYEERKEKAKSKLILYRSLTGKGKSFFYIIIADHYKKKGKKKEINIKQLKSNIGKPTKCCVLFEHKPAENSNCKTIDGKDTLKEIIEEIKRGL